MAPRSSLVAQVKFTLSPELFPLVHRIQQTRVCKRGTVIHSRILRFILPFSDHTMKLWDIGERRCIASYTMHSDSVWSLKASAGFDRIYSGGRLVGNNLPKAQMLLAPIIGLIIGLTSSLPYVSGDRRARGGCLRYRPHQGRRFQREHPPDTRRGPHCSGAFHSSPIHFQHH